MIEELKKLQIELQNNTQGQITISQELYDLLVAECNQAQNLLALVNSQRAKSTARVLLDKDILSEQVDEFDVPEIGRTKDDLNDYYAYNDSILQSSIYEGILREPELKQIKRKITAIVRDSNLDPFPLEFLTKKPKGSVAIYDIVEDAYVSEFFKSMDCYSEDEINQTFGSMSMNFMQIDWLYKYKKLDYNMGYVVFLNQKGKVLPYTISASTNKQKKFSSWGPITNLSKRKKILLFSPNDLVDKE